MNGVFAGLEAEDAAVPFNVNIQKDKDKDERQNERQSRVCGKCRHSQVAVYLRWASVKLLRKIALAHQRLTLLTCVSSQSLMTKRLRRLNPQSASRGDVARHHGHEQQTKG